MKKILIIVVLFSFYLANAADFLMPNEAFKPHMKLNEKMQVEVGIELGKDIYLYEKQIKLKIVAPSEITIAHIQKPQSVSHHDEQVYLDSPLFVVELATKEKLSSNLAITLLLSYQGCSEQGLCYEPSEKEFVFDVDASLLKIAEPKDETQESIESKKSSQKQELSQTDAIAETIKSSSAIIMLLTFFGFGLLLSLTPCVFPMIPIISGIIISQGEGLSTRRAFALSLVYVLAMAIAYTIAGVLAGLFGSNLQAALQTPWVIYSFAGVFVLLAMSMFGYFELKVPDSLVTKMSRSSSKSGFVGVAIMGFLSALIVGPCVAAPLAGALVYIGQTGDALLGGAALFSMSIGMGIPLIIVGVSAGKFMPKPGEWMTMVTAIFGIMMLGVAIWMLERVVSSETTMLLYSLLGIGTALYLGALKSEGHIFKRSVAMILFVYSIALFLGYLAGASSMTKPLTFMQTSSSTPAPQIQKNELAFKVVTSIEELDAFLEKNRGKKILLDFVADWCISCRELDEVTFADIKVQEKLGEYLLVRADVTKNDDKAKVLSKRYGVFGPPALIFFDANLEVISSKTIIGFIEPKQFIEHLNSF